MRFLQPSVRPSLAWCSLLLAALLLSALRGVAGAPARPSAPQSGGAGAGPDRARLDQLEAVIRQARADYEKAYSGNKAATARVRKSMQEVKALAQDIRADMLLVRDFPPGLESSDRRLLHVITLGHVGHGKSTLTAAIVGYLARLSAAQPQQPVEFAHPSTIGALVAATHVEYETAKRRYLHTDCAGHADYVKVLISGAVRADAGILVVSAADGPMPQTREHILLARRTGIEKLVVFLNKVDLVDDEELVELVELEVRELLSKYELPGDDIPVVRGSALKALQALRGIAQGDTTARVFRIVSQQMGVVVDRLAAEMSLVGDLGADELDQVELVMELEDEFNISISDADAEGLDTVGASAAYVRSALGQDGEVVDESALLPIAELLAALDEVPPGPPLDQGDFLMAVEDAFSVADGVAATGRVERGRIAVSEGLELVGLGGSGVHRLSRVDAFQEVRQEASAEEKVGLVFEGLEPSKIQRGMVLASPGSIAAHTRFQAEIYALSSREGGRRTPFFNGFRPQVSLRTVDVGGVVRLLRDVEMVMPGDNVQVEVRLQVPVALKLYQRFVLREGGRPMGVGVVTRILE